MANSKKQMLLLSNSTVWPCGYLEFARNWISEFLCENGVSRVLFIPYAMPKDDYRAYYDKVKSVLQKWGIQVECIDAFDDPRCAVANAKAFFVGGGNTFRLLKTLYDKFLVEPIRNRVLDGTPYIGYAAGTTIAGYSMNTTNDMPITLPPSLHALDMVPFCLNPHYVGAKEKCHDEVLTRDERLKEFLREPDSRPVVALREGSALHINCGTAILRGKGDARVFRHRQGEPTIHKPGTDFAFLKQELYKRHGI